MIFICCFCWTRVVNKWRHARYRDTPCICNNKTANTSRHTPVNVNKVLNYLVATKSREKIGATVRITFGIRRWPLENSLSNIIDAEMPHSLVLLHLITDLWELVHVCLKVDGLDIAKATRRCVHPFVMIGTWCGYYRATLDISLCIRVCSMCVCVCLACLIVDQTRGTRYNKYVERVPCVLFGTPSHYALGHIVDVWPRGLQCSARATGTVRTRYLH